MAEAKKREIGKILTYGANFSELVLSLGILVLILGVSVLILGVLIFFYPGRKSFGAYIHACSMFFFMAIVADVVLPHRKGPWCGRRGNRACLHSVHHD